MAQVDNRNSSASKRARTDGGRREDDWTCTSCGNVNFSFRTSCNMRNCTQARPADHNSKFPAKPLQSPHRSYAAPYVGSGAPSSMYASVPPYGSPLFSGSSMPPYDVRYSGGSAYPYDYGGRISGGSPFRALHISAPAPPPYSGGAVMGNGMYGMPPMMDRYGMGMPVAPTGLPPRFGYFPDDRPQKKEVARENDWKCPKCGNVNFSFRTVCNMRSCDTPKPMSQPQGTKSDKSSKHKVPDGSWKCEQCNNINYPFRTKCNNQNCGADKPSDENAPSSEPTNENNQ